MTSSKTGPTSNVKIGLALGSGGARDRKVGRWSMTSSKTGPTSNVKIGLALGSGGGRGSTDAGGRS